MHGSRRVCLDLSGPDLGRVADDQYEVGPDDTVEAATAAMLRPCGGPTVHTTVIHGASLHLAHGQ